MKLQKQKPRQTINPAFRRQRPSRTEIDLFKANLLTLLDKIDETESEEHVKNQVRDFLRDTYYKETNEVNTKGRQDLAIYTGKTNESKVGVIIETKRPKNSAEWFKGDNANCKAFQELVLYYLRERENLKNIDIKYLIATNIYEWYIIESSYFENLFFKDKDFLKDYVEFDKKQKVTTNTDLFYNSIAKPFIDSIDKTIPCAYFNIKEFDKAIRSSDKKEDTNLIALIKILSPSHLLKLEFVDDSNSLKESFYKELLHIIGLEERKEGGKNIIDRKKEGQRQAGSLIENAINMLETEDPLHKIPDLSVYGKDKGERIYNIALELCITWVNRILFLKLLEGQLQNYHQKKPEYLFLNSEKIPNYDELHKLFHQVLAKTIDERKKNSLALSEKYKRVPYLNSSLFDFSKLEELTIKINQLDNDYQIDLIPSTVLKEIKKNNQGLPSLDYLFRFLNAFDFSSEGGEEIQEDENRTLINASVLGKVFEKINGYKEGSIYTPGFITMYMCSKAIRASVLQKFKEEHKWKIEHFADLKNYLKDRRTTKEILEDNALINSIRLCDPAVGSGHFLVSSLNEIIAIKSELGLLADKSGDRLSDYQIVIAQDELIVTDQNGNDFKYEINNGKPLNKEMQRLQKALFEEKQSIIENCLFGVDINPNSVKICRLRLWIELLKNAYYKEDTNFQELETLPNIDINIKCNNSLISRFALDADLSKALKSIKYNIKAYKGFVNDYKNAKSREVKRGLEVIIDGIKNDFRTEIGKNDPKQIRLNKISGDLYNLLNQTKIFELEAKQIKAQKEKKDKLETEINKLANEIDEIKTNALYKNAFEWRFEFPEVLDNEGNFEGFDIVIGNPPYVFGGNEGISDIHKRFFKGNYKSGSGKINLFNLFIEKGFNLLKRKGEFAFIIPNTFLRVTSYHESRKLLIDNFKVNAIADFGANVFAEATTTAIVLLATKIRPSENSTIEISNGEVITNTLLQSALKLNYVIALNVNAVGQGLIDKMRIESVSLGEICKELIFGVVITKNRDEVVSTVPKKGWKPFIEGRDIGRYYVKPVYQYLNYQPELLHRARSKVVFEAKEKLLIQRISGGSQPIKVAYDNRQIYNKESINNLILADNSRFNIKYILSLLNSKIINWFYNNQFTNESMLTVNISKEYLSQIPIKNASLDTQKVFASIADYIIFSKSIQDQLFPSFFERLIDALVYELYLPNAMKNGNCEVLKHLRTFSELETDNNEKNMKTIEKYFKELSHPTHPINSAILRMRNIEEIEFIENKKMKRITAIEIENYRAFYQQYKPLLLPKGENLLLYGENGSGKSSLFKALSNYFSSSQNPAFPFSKNHHSLAANGLLKITFEEYTLATNTITTGTAQQLNFSSIAGASTNNLPFLKDTEFIKGFLDYRNLLDVYNHKEARPNLFKLIVTELLLHFTASTGGATYAFGERWLWLIPEMRDVHNRNTLKHRNAKNTLPSFQAALEESLRRIFLQLNKLLMQYFNFNLRVWFTLQPIVYQYDWNNWHPNADLRLDLTLNGVSIPNQQDYLNEARLSALSVCLYLAAVLQNPSYTGFDYKILFLDDIFIGLDAGNRIPILKILNDKFPEYQIFISTYDRHWFELARNHFAVEAPDKWKTAEFYVGKDKTGTTEFEKPIVVEGETNFEKAVRFLNHRSKPDYPAAANYFRKALEEIIQNYVPKYEKTSDDFIQTPDYKLTKLVFNTQNYLHKTGNAVTHINSIAGLISDLMHPLSHHQIASPVYKGELQILQTEIPQLKQQLISIDHNTNHKCMLETKKQLKITFTVNTANRHSLYYEIELHENLLKIFNGGGLPFVSLCKCRATKGSGTNNGTKLPNVSIGKNNPVFNYISLKDAYDKIHAFWVSKIGGFPFQANYLDAIQYHDGTNWQPINTILPW